MAVEAARLAAQVAMVAEATAWEEAACRLYGVRTLLDTTVQSAVWP